MTAPATDELRRADLGTLRTVLEDVRSRALDVIVPGRELAFRSGFAVVKGVEPVIDEQGVTTADGLYRPTTVADEGLATRLDIPLAYVRRLREHHLPLLDANLNGWLERDYRSHLLRLVRTTSDDTIPGLDDQVSNGIVRAVLSDRYKAIDNFDVVLAVLAGVQRSGVDPAGLQVHADLTERRMALRIVAPQITANAVGLVERYRDPLSGQTGRQQPLVAAGLRVTNSEVGQGGFSVAPYLTFLVCTNGQTVTKDATKAVHLGGKLESGVVSWSSETQKAALNLATSKTADMVKAFMSPDYLEGQVRIMQQSADVKIGDPTTVIPLVARQVGFTAEQASDILSAFIQGADTTAHGVMQAVTYCAQHTRDGEAAIAMEDRAMDVLTTAARLAHTA